MTKWTALRWKIRIENHNLPHHDLVGTRPATIITTHQQKAPMPITFNKREGWLYSVMSTFFHRSLKPNISSGSMDSYLFLASHLPFSKNNQHHLFKKTPPSCTPTLYCLAVWQISDTNVEKANICLLCGTIILHLQGSGRRYEHCTYSIV